MNARSNANHPCSAALTAMRLVYENICKNKPTLLAQQSNLQKALRERQEGSFAAFHGMYYSAALRYRLTTMASPSFQQIRDHDTAIVVCIAVLLH
jgi:hypothetical protein